ncbi:MAG TPA: class I SAM-dependent methyltransferase [Vicinamibacteria bacterium]|nr:class I SAM-dependent methyltransferase [Vicinamibacteria bacterium]
MTLDSRQRFTAAAEDYSRHRPTYPPELVEWIAAETGLPPSAAVADIGCGTGIAARLFASLGFDVVGVEPNADMLAHATAAGVRCVQGEAARTGLPDRSVDLVIAAQAFHWFDVPAALAEFRRICRPPGWCAAFWNMRSGSPLMDEYESLLLKTSEDYRKIRQPAHAVSDLRAAPEISGMRFWEFPSGQVLDRDGFFGRVWSSSFVVHGVADRDAFNRELAALFERHQQDGRVDFRYRTVAFLWQLQRPSAAS